MNDVVMWFKLVLLFIFYGTVSTQQSSLPQEVIPEFCEDVITSNLSVEFLIPSNRTSSSDDLDVVIAEGFEGCFRRWGLSQIDRSSCSYPYIHCVCSYTNNEWSYYSCGPCSRRDTEAFFDTCVLLSPRPATERSEQRGESSALLGWLVMVVFVFALSCCCRLFRNQICCDCCYDTLNSSRSFALTEIGVARASTPTTDHEEEESSSSRKPLTAVPMDQVVVVYNPDEEDINVGVQKAS